MQARVTGALKVPQVILMFSQSEKPLHKPEAPKLICQLESPWNCQRSKFQATAQTNEITISGGGAGASGAF